MELDSVEYWYKDLPIICETLQIDRYQVNMLGLCSLKEFYRQGMKAKANKTDENGRIKYEALKANYELLEQVKDQSSMIYNWKNHEI